MSIKALNNANELRDEQLTILLNDRLGLSEIIKALFELRQQRQSNFSLRAFGKKAGIASSGFLSDIMKGRRALPIKYAKKAALALGLNGDSRNYFCLLFERQNIQDHLKLEKVSRDLARIKARLERADLQVTDKTDDVFFALEVYAVFGLFKNRAEFEQLLAFFGQERKQRVSNAVQFLIKNGLIAQSKDHFTIVKPLVHFTTDREPRFYEKYMSAVLLDAQKKLPFWYSKRNDALFTTSVVSVDMVKYREKLPRIKAALLDLISEIDSPNADNVVRINFQVFPFNEV